MQALQKKEIAPDDDYAMGVIRADKGEPAEVLEFDHVPLEVELEDFYDLFDDTETVESLEEKFDVDLSSYQLINADWLAGNDEGD